MNFLTVLMCASVFTLASTTKTVDIKLLKDEKVIYVSGTVAEYLPDPVFYDTYVPVIYEFGIPQHMDSAVKINWDHANVCNKSDSRYDGKLCPVVYHLHKVIGNLTADMGFWKEYYTTETDKLPPTEKSANSVICDEINQHFDNHYTSHAQLEKYISNLKSCLLGDFFQKSTFSSKWVIDKSVYYTMIERYYTEFYRALPSAGLVDWAVTLDMYVALQGMLLTNNFIESSQVIQAVSSCKSGFLPEAFVKKSILKKSLDSLYEKINGVHYEYVFDKDKDLSPYYKYELADCTFTDNFTLAIRVLIPLKIADVQSKLLQITTYPFIENVDNDTKLCTLKTPGKMNMIESSSGLLFETHCHQPNELCKVTELNSYYQSDGCVSAVLSNSEIQILQNCALNCFSIDPMATLPMFRKIASDTFVATGTSTHKIFITCNEQPFEMLKLKDEGSLQIKLACNCRITYRSQVFRPTLPCGNHLTLSHIMPYHWEEEKMGKTTKGPKYHVDEIPTNKSTASKPNIADHFNETVIERQIYMDLQNSNSVSKGLITQLCFLWILLIILLASTMFLLYQVHILVKWKEIQVYKDTRIVYNVPESPKVLPTSKF